MRNMFIEFSGLVAIFGSQWVKCNNLYKIYGTSAIFFLVGY